LGQAREELREALDDLLDRSLVGPLLDRTLEHLDLGLRWTQADPVGLKPLEIGRRERFRRSLCLT
jgi:hypothetical protein